MFSISLILRLHNLDGQSLWYDETFTVLISQMPFTTGIEIMLVDSVHPPLFYWVVKAFLRFGTSEWVVRLPAVMFGLFGVASIYLITNEWFGKRSGILAGMLLALSPFHLWYSQDARMYTMLAFFALVCMWGYGRILARPSLKGYVIFTAVSAFAYLTHYFALFLPLIQFVYLVIKLRKYPNQLRLWTLLQVIASLPLLMWIYLLYQREINNFGIGWIPQPGLEDLLLTVVNFTIGHIFPLSLFDWMIAMGLLILVIWGVMRHNEEGSWTTLLVLWAIMPLFFILTLSTKRPTYVDRFFILSLPAFLILLTQGLVRLGRRWSIVTSSIVLLILSWRAFMIIGTHESLKKEEWRKAVQYLETEVGADEVIIPRVLQISIPLQYYIEENLHQEAMEVNRKVKPLQEIVKGYSGAWLVYWNVSRDAHALVTQGRFEMNQETDPIALAWIAGEGPKVLERKDFKGITIFHFWLEDYLDTQNPNRSE